MDAELAWEVVALPDGREVGVHTVRLKEPTGCGSLFETGVLQSREGKAYFPVLRQYNYNTADEARRGHADVIKSLTSGELDPFSKEA